MSIFQQLSDVFCSVTGLGIKHIRVMCDWLANEHG